MRVRRLRGWVGHRMPHRVRAAVVTAVVVLTTGCSGLLEQEAAGSVAASDLDSPAAVGLLVASAIASFECAQTQVAYFTGLVSDELADAQGATTGWEIDRRTVSAASPAHTTTCAGRQSPGLYTPLSQARFQADDAIARLETFSDAEVTGRGRLLGQMAAYGGFSLALLGESMCSAAIDIGAEMTPAQLFAAAETRFTLALEQAAAANDAATLDMARLGRARVRLNLGKDADARADAMLVPANFVANATHSAGIVRRQNRIHDALSVGNYATIAPPFRDLAFGGVSDLRAGTITNAGVNGADTRTPIWRTSKFPASTTPTPIAKWAEAQLIIAEIDGGQAAVDIINGLHDRAGLPHFQSADEAEIRAQVYQERSRELFLEGRRLWDIIRGNLPLVPAPGTAFEKGGSYGSQLCVPLPDIERQNNPNIPN